MKVYEIKEKKILEILKNLPPDKLEEVIDFAECLKKKEPQPVKPKRNKHTKFPAFHLGKIAKGAFEREFLYGEYLDQKLG